jgi:hypothetical protein
MCAGRQGESLGALSVPPPPKGYLALDLSRAFSTQIPKIKNPQITQITQI